MRYYRTIALAFALTLPIAAPAQKSKDALIVDPKVHSALFENDYVRVFEARASHPATSPMHSHPPFVFIGLEQARAKFGLPDGKSIIFDVSPGQVLWLGDGMEHSWELLSGKVRVIAVEVKSATTRSGGALTPVSRKANDPVTVDPDVHHVLLENDHVRVFDARGTKGRKSPMHSHSPFVFVSLGTARLSLTLPDGKNALLDTYPGQVMWLDNAEHAWEILSGDLHVIAVEVKAAQRKPQPKSD